MTEEDKVWMLVHPSGARSGLDSKIQTDAVLEVLNMCGPEYLAKGAHLEYGPRSLMNQGLCDFCLTPGGGWRYEADDYEGLPHQGQLGKEFTEASRGAWLACDACHTAYQGGGLDALIERGMQAQLRIHPELTDHKDALREAVRTAYEQFEFMRRGEPTAVNKE